MDKSKNSSFKQLYSKNRLWFSWCLYDWANSAFATVILAALLPVYFAHIVPSEGASIPLLGESVQASVLWSFAVGFSMLLIVLIAPYIGSISDKKSNYRHMLLFFCLVGASATCLLYFAHFGDYLYAATIFVLANFCFAAANIFYNAFLPLLANEGQIDRLSAYGFALGYIGGALCLILIILMAHFHALLGWKNMYAAIRAGFLITGAWWALFGIPVFFALRRMPTVKRLVSLPAGLKGYLHIFSEIKNYRNLVYFLIAFLFYNDGIQTIISISAIYAKDILELSRSAILGCLLMIQFVAMPGAIIFAKLSEKLGAKTSIILALVVFIGITVYAGFITTVTEFWVLGLCVALVLGGSQAVSRSLFGSMIPYGKYAELFGFYAMSSKFASIFGPFIFASIGHLTGSPRFSILFLTLFFFTGIFFLIKVRPEKKSPEQKL